MPEGRFGWYGNDRMNDPGRDSNGLPGTAVGNNTYKAIRVISDEYNLYYNVWCTNESELYNLKVCTKSSGYDKIDGAAG